MRAFLALFVFVPLLAFAAPACSPLVGDSCTDSTDCGRSMFCEQSLPDGYCTVENCENKNCPDAGVCIRFTEDVSWCMQTCEGNGDCRDGYTCVKDFGAYPFCNDKRGTVPASE